MNIEKIEIDTKDVASKLSFLIGKTIMFRDGLSDATIATGVHSLKAENTPGTEGHPQIVIYTAFGIRIVKNTRELNDIMVLDEDGSATSLGKYADEVGIYF